MVISLNFEIYVVSAIELLLQQVQDTWVHDSTYKLFNVIIKQIYFFSQIWAWSKKFDVSY